MQPYQNKSQTERGKIRISEHYNQPWRGFTLQRGHFFGQDYNGDYFVSGLERVQNGKIAVYFMRDLSTQKWEKEFIPVDRSLGKRLLKALQKRKEMGIEKVEFPGNEWAYKHGGLVPSCPRKYRNTPIWRGKPA